MFWVKHGEPEKLNHDGMQGEQHYGYDLGLSENRQFNQPDDIRRWHM